jgi:hypothetical protein
MPRTIWGSIAGAPALSALDLSPAQAAPAKQRQVSGAATAATLDMSARRRHHRYYRRYGYYYGYGYGPLPAYYYRHQVLLLLLPLLSGSRLGGGQKLPVWRPLLT